jgi:hypothetical protein
MYLTEAIAAPAMLAKNDAVSGRSSGRCFDDARAGVGCTRPTTTIAAAME